MNQQLSDARPPLGTEALAFTDAALMAEQVERLRIPKDVCRFAERLALAVDHYHPWPSESENKKPSSEVIAGCGAVDSSSVDGQLIENISTEGMDGDSDAVLTLSSLSPSKIDPALIQRSLLVKAFPYGREMVMPDVGKKLDDLRRRVLDEIQDLCLLTRARQIIKLLREASEWQDVRTLERELLEIMKGNEACAQELPSRLPYTLREHSDPDFKAFVESRGVHISNK